MPNFSDFQCIMFVSLTHSLQKFNGFLSRLYKWTGEHTVLLYCLLFLFYAGCLCCFCTLEHWHVSRDGILYLNAAETASAENFLHYSSQDYYFPPLFVMCMVHAQHWLQISPQTTGFFICIFCGALCPVLVSAAAGRLFHDRLFAFLSGLMFFLIPEVRNVSANILRDSPSLCLNSAGIYCFILFRQRQHFRYAFLCGFFIAAAFGFRYENLEYLIILPALNLLSDLISEKKFSFFGCVKEEFIFLSCLLGGTLCGMALIFLMCWNSDFFTIEMFYGLKKSYLGFF